MVVLRKPESPPPQISTEYTECQIESFCFKSGHPATILALMGETEMIT